jgi:hypothetical protein
MKRSVLLWLFFPCLFAVQPVRAQFLKKLKEKANQAVNKTLGTGETNSNSNSSSTSQDNNSSGGKPTNKGGGGLKNTTPPMCSSK